MSTVARWIVLSALALAGCEAAPPARDLQAQDFARGMTLAAPANEPFFRIELPDRVLTETAWPDLRDLRVFNGAGESVPFARLVPPTPKGEGRRIPLQQFRLAPVKSSGIPQIDLDARARGVELRVAPGSAPESGVEYVLASSEDAAGAPVEGLHLDWQDHRENWTQKVTVAVSDDLQSWSTIAVNRPVMDLKTADGQRLKHGEIALNRRPPGPGRYWRLHFDTGFAPRLTSVEAEVTTPSEAPPHVTFRAPGDSAIDGSARYQLPATLPIARVRITPTEPNSVLPVQIDGRLGSEDPWRPLATSVVYRINAEGGEQLSVPVALGGQMVRELRLRPFGAAWGERVPTVEVERDQVVLVVNARGSGPFLLAWGSRVAEDGALPLTTLVPGHAAGAPLDFAAGTLLAPQTLGGPERLTAPTPGERAARWQTILVWFALIGSALALGALAMRVWRDYQANPPRV